MRTRQIIAVLWAIIGASTLIWGATSAVSAYRYFGFVSGGVKSGTIFAVFGIVVVLGALLSLRQLVVGARLLKISSSFALLYVAAYLLFGGLEDAPGYLLGVIAIAIISVVTLVAYSKTRLSVA